MCKYYNLNSFNLSPIPAVYFFQYFQIYVYPDNKNVAPPGRTFDPITVDTTYLTRTPVNYIPHPTIKKYVPLPFFPQDSLKSLRHFKYEKANDESWKALFANNDLPEKVKV